MINPTNPYLAPARIRASLGTLGLRPTRGMGQNFLIDSDALQQIVEAANLSPTELVIEVGPGLGVLTWELLQRVEHVLAVELDKRLAARLRAEFVADIGAARANALHVVQGDILDIPVADLLCQAQATWPSFSTSTTADTNTALPVYKVVANLPYAITSPVLRHFLEQTPHPVLVVVLVQWEVARRITAGPGDLSMLAHAIQMYAQPEIVARVPASSFLPPPAVDSAILRLQMRPLPAVTVADAEQFFRLLKAGFLQPRKKLSNALPTGLNALGHPRSREEIGAALEAAGVAAARRADTVTLQEWAAIYEILYHSAA